jgi:hypothetical protein
VSGVILPGRVQSEPVRQGTRAGLQSVGLHAAPVLALALREYAQAAHSRSSGMARLAQAALSAPGELQELALASQLGVGVRTTLHKGRAPARDEPDACQHQYGGAAQ